MSLPVLPIILVRTALSAMPLPLLARFLTALIRKMERRHPRLFVNLRRLPKASVRIEPVDVARHFWLTLGESGVSLQVLEDGGDKGPADAVIRGKLHFLLDMLEGRTDGDTLFFSRDLTITGDTSVIVGLRNTLDREEIDILQEALALTGPFSNPAEKVLGIMARIARVFRAEVANAHERMHPNSKREGADAP